MAGRRQWEPASDSDSDSDETIVAGSVQESEEEEEDERRADRMLFFHKNAFQLYNTMNDSTSRLEAPFGGSSSPVIQLIPKTNIFRIHMENHQQQVKTLAYDEATQLGQSQTVLRSGVTCVTGVSSSDRTIFHVPRIDIEHNYSQGSLTDSNDIHFELLQLKKEKLQLKILIAKLLNKVLNQQKDLLDIQKRNLQSPSTALPIQHPVIYLPVISGEDFEDTDETMLDTDMSNDLPVQNNEQEISDDENAPEINLLTGALITLCTPAWEGRKSFADELSLGNCTSTMHSVFSRHDSLPESSNDSDTETVDSLQGSLTHVSPQEEISARENFEQNQSLKSTSNKIPIIDLLRPLSDESTTGSLTTMNLSPLMDSLDALSDGATTVESLAERKDALPVELWAALNKMPLMAPVLPVKETPPSVNEKSAFNSSTQCVVKETLPPVDGKAANDSSIPHNLEHKAGLFALHSSDKAVNDPSIQDNLEHRAGIFALDDSDKTEIDSSIQDNLEHETSEYTLHNSDKATNGSSVQDNLERKDGLLTLHGSDKAVNDPSIQDNLEHSVGVFTLNDSDKTEIDSSIQDNLDDKAGNAEVDEDLTQITDYEPNSQPSGKPEHLEHKKIEFSHDKNKTEADTSKYEMMEKSTEGKTFNVSHVNLTTASHQPNVAGPTILRKSSRRIVPTNSMCSSFESSTCKSQRFQFHKRSAEIKRKAVIPDHEEPSAKLLQRSEEKKGPTSQNSQLAFKNNLEHWSQHGMYNKLIDNNNSQSSKINNVFGTNLLCSKLQSRQLFSNLQDCPKIRTRTLGQINEEKERENMVNVETKSKQKRIQHRTTSIVKAHENSRTKKGNSVNYYDVCQDRPQRSTTKPVDEEAVITRSAILKLGKITHRKNIYGESKLHRAALNGDVNLLRTLIQAGANINFPDYAGWTALHEATYHGFHEVVSVLLTSGANVNSKGLNNVIPLQDAVGLGHLKVVQLLMQHGADPFEKNDFGNCAMDLAVDNHMKQLIKSYQERRKVTVKVGDTQKLPRHMVLKNTVDNKKLEVCNNDKMAATRSHVLNKAASFKRKTESTHQAERDVQPNKKIQSLGTMLNINENQPKHIDMKQNQRRPVIHDMVESQSQFATHSGLQITQSDFFEIQTKSASTTVNKAVTKPASENPVVIGNTTGAQTSLRRSARARNSISGFTVQAEDNSATSKQCQSVLSISHAEGSTIERLDCKNVTTAIVSRHNLGTAASIKRKTESTHQAKSDVQPNKKTQTTGTKRNINENQPKHIDVEQPQRGPVILVMVESQSQFGTYSGQKIIQSNFSEIQTKSASTTVNEAVTTPAGSNVSVQNPVVIANTTVPQTSLRRSARFRNSICSFTVQAEDSSATSKLCQSALSISHAEGSNIERTVCKKDKKATTSSHVLDISASFKRKTESTHQAKSDVEPNKKIQTTGTKRNPHENQPKHIDLEQPQRRPLILVMVESQSQFATHSGQKIIQSDFSEIQTKSASTTVNEAVTTPAGSNVSVQSPVVVVNTTVPQTSLRRSARFRNSICSFTVQAEDNSATSKLCQSALSISHAEGSNIERLVCKKDKKATTSSHVLDISASLKRKTESTHQAKSDVQPNKKIQSTGTKRNPHENQPKHIDMEQPQRRPVTHVMVESQSQFAAHSGQKNIQSDFSEIQTKSASTTVTEAVIKPAGSNVSFQNPVVIGNTTVSQTSLRQSARSRNSICGFTVQAEDNSATSKLCQSVLSISHADGSNIERLVCKNDQMAALSIHDPDTAASLKRKTQCTHQAKSDVQPNTKTQSAGTVHNVNENQPKHIDVEQPQRRPVTRDMVESQSNFVTHSGQKITQSDFFEIQTKSASTTVNEAVTKPDGSNVSFHNPAVIGNTTVPETSLRRSARSRNSICGFTVQAEDNSATPKPCQSVLSISHAEGSNIERLVCKNDKLATMSSHVLDISASLKRKTESTHQAKSDVQPNKKTQSSGTKRNLNENQPKHIDVEHQPQGRPVTHVMVESQSTFATHSGQEITQPGFFEIQTKSTSPTVNEAVTKPASENVSFQNPVIIANTTVPQTSQRRSARTRNSICGFTVQAEDNSATSKLCQSVLSISHADGSNIERLVCKNDQMAALSIHDPDTAASLKRKTQSTHQAKSDVQPNTKTQSAGTVQDINENQPKHIDVEQPQGRPVTRDMVESQTQFATHSGQEITQSDFLEILTKSASTTVNKAVNKPASSNVSLHNPVVIGNTTVPQISLRRSARLRNSICGFTVQAEDNSATSKLCQSALSISHAEGSNIERMVCKNDKMAVSRSHVLDISASLKRKTESTHLAKSDVQPNKKTQSTGTMHTINENQPKHIDVEQPQRRPVTHDMVESQSQFATHSGQEITQSNFFEIQTKSASTTVNEAVTKPASSNVSFQIPIVIGNTTVPQTTLRRSARFRNSICDFTVLAGDNSATSKLCQSGLSISQAEGSNIERLVCKNGKMAAISIHDPDTAASLKRKTQGTHQAKSDVQPNTKTQSAGTVQNINENQPKQVDVEQPRRRPVTRDMVESQSQFATHSGQEITQCNFLEIQTKSASTTVNEAVTMPASSNVSLHNPVVIGNTTVPQTFLRQSARSRNSICGFTVQAEDNSSTSKQCQSVLSISHAKGSKNETLVRKLYLSAPKPTVNQITTPNTEVESIDKSCTVNMLESARNKSNATVATDGKLVTIEVPKEHSTNEKLAQLKKYPKVQVHEEILSKVASCNQNVEMAQKPEYERARENSIHENTISDPSPQTHWKNNLPDHDNSSEINKSVEYIPSAESMTAAELPAMEDTLQRGEIKQFDHTKNKTLEDNLDAYVVPSDVLENRCNPPMISAYESRENLLKSMTSDHVSLQQKNNCSTVLGSERNDDVIIEYESCHNVVSTLQPTEAAILDGTPGEYPKDTMTANNQSNNNTPTCDMVSCCKVNVETTVLVHVSGQDPSSAPQTDIDESNANLSELHTNNLNDAKKLSRAINMEIDEDVNVNEPGDNINDIFANNNFRESAEETSKNAPEHVLTESCRSSEKNNTLQNREGMSNVQSSEINTNARKKTEREKSFREQHITESSGSPMQDVVVPKHSLPIPKLSALNKKNCKGETRLHLAVMKRDICSVRSLIVAGTSVNIQDNAGWTALLEACSRGLTDIIQELLKAGADVNFPALNGVSPLQDAVSGSHYEAVKVLLQYGADPMQKDKEGKNAFDEIVNDKIKDLLETHSNHRNSDVTICDEPQPDKDQQQVEDAENEKQAECTPEDSSATPNLPLGPPPDTRVSCDDNQTTTVSQNYKGLESPHCNISQHESITITLDEIQTKQERIIKCELKEPESATQFELELSQMRTVLNEILTKHKVEKEDLVKKFRVSPGSFRQGTLQKQVTALATRQRRFLNLLQKQKTLEHKLCEYQLKERQSQQNNIETQRKSLTCTTESRVRTDAPSKKVQFLDQNEGLGDGCATEGAEQISIARESECLQPDNLPSQGETNISANQETNTTTVVVDDSTGRGKENVAPTNVLDATSRDGSISTISASEPDPSHRESNSLQSRPLEMSQLQVESLNSSQTETNRDSTPCSSSSQDIHLSTAQSISNPENNTGRVCNSMLVNTEKSTVTSVLQTSSNQQCFLPAATQPTTYLMPMNSTQQQFTGQPNILKSNLKLIVVPNGPQNSRIQQLILPLNNVGASVNYQNTVKVNASQPDNRGSNRVNNRQVTSNNQGHSLPNASSLSGREHNIKSLPVGRGTGQRKLLHLIDLIKDGLIQPGEDVLDLKLQGVCYKADLLATGIIRDKDRKLYRNPMHWIKELLEEKITVSRSFAWSKVRYKGKELDKYRSIITTSSKTPETQSIPKPILSTDETSSVTMLNSICADYFPQIQRKKSNSSFMQLREILLIRNEEFLPCHIMNQHWKFYAESDEWNF